MVRTVWGVDSASAVSPSLFECVVNQFGKPEYWGRYLTTVENVSDGLTQEEIQFLQDNRIKIMPIYNVFREAVGYRQGEITATNAIFHARRLGIPTGTFIFANIEHFFMIDEAWLRGWIDAFYPSGFKPDFYNDPVRGQFNEAFCQAVINHKRVKEQAVLWSAEPENGVTTKQNRPRTFAPATPDCDALVWGWQYGRDAEECPIDTNLIDRKLYESLW
ncbi:glycoside hydrolase domain-containing protein [Alkalihalobacterium bogoriense]|uniref:glycoside hydrolase domain-containing protein n=1 Tax=Alkalihalobacterium bogoriense TaxID=246272 RepID=UPI00047892A5|nr:glycoside hydrolase domain-containing protein [Alkalihalobacterium bogoriense]